MNLPALAQIRRIARSGDTVRAWRMFDAAGLLASDDREALSLKGRLLKDRALRSDGGERSLLLAEAQAAYMQAADGRRATYPLINAATLAFLNDRPDEAGMLARQILALLESGAHEQETRYWLAATAAEAHLLLGDHAASQAALAQAMAAAPEAWEDHAATLRQFSQILVRQNLSPALLDHLRPPPSLYFSGIIGLPDDEGEAREQIGALLDDIRPGALFGALAAGADILIAEMALERGAQLHVVLPIPLASFRETSVLPFGNRWLDRFHRLVEAADYLDVDDGVSHLSDAAVTKAAEIAMGLALRRAEAFATQAHALHVGRTPDTSSPAHRLWQARGLPFHALTLAQSTPPPGSPLAAAGNAAILASTQPFPDAGHGREASQTASGIHVLALADIVAAMRLAGTMLRTVPDIGLSLEYRTRETGVPIDGDDGLAPLLARAAPAGSICAPWPQAAALDLHDPAFRFEMAGEVMTAYGDCPVGHYYPPSD
ncbi:TRAFs-binding domain-containing protein [Sphingobium sp. AP49]|uniref:tetratricopeptide repeat-containing protein n=1 Tax=Sphingobium sp. AP49 TaxID=1144307 RepID=UPI00026EE343|nr:tetratricopeptide repeat-containing protein [Sphingobium sp. AP49]WHO40138.1 TRAFs-binding domain-containing protein [Sphingobium sp. AP49]